jgi:hypothetical protein
MCDVRTKTLLAAWTLLLLAAVPVMAQQMQLAQPFAPADMSKYGGGYRANEGFFFRFDGQVWWPSKPDPNLIGDPTTRRVVITPQDPDVDNDGAFDPGFEPQKVIETSTHGTGTFNTEETSGQRYDFGFIEGHHGWLASILNIREQSQSMFVTEAHVVFDDAAFGFPPQYHLQGPIWIGDHDEDDATPPNLWIDDLQVKFDELEARYEVETWGAELNYMYRMHPFHHGGILELFIGGRYMEIEDRFFVDARETIFMEDEDEPETPGNIPHGLGDSWWDNRVENHIVGPQIGLRWFRKASRWTCSTEARFFSGFNQQSIKQRGLLGDKMNPLDVRRYALEQEDVAADAEEDALLKITNMSPTAFSHDRRFHEWSPAAELRVDLKYQLTKSVSTGAGWTGIWIDGIARAPNTIDYVLGQDSVMGIGDQNHEDMFLHAISVFIELNR